MTKSLAPLLFFLLIAIVLGCQQQSGSGNNPLLPSSKAPATDEAALQAPVAAPVPADSALINDLCYGYKATPQQIKMYWKREGAILYDFAALAKLEPRLVFAMNGGMFTEDFAPVGLYIEDGRHLKGMRRYNNPKVNFGLQPQGVFLLQNNKAAVVSVDAFKAAGVRYATQSAPMLVLEGRINPRLPHSKSKAVRNGVGMLPDGRVLMAVSNFSVTFQEFAQYFVDKGCTSALYLDGGVSGAYSATRNDDGDYGVMIGVVGE